MKPVFFADAAEFRGWLEVHHASAREIQVGFNKKASGLGGLTYQEAVLEALCFGWIDGVLGRIDAQRYQQRFTPRQKSSTWSNVNIAHVARLTADGRMMPAGLAAFAARHADRSGIYSFEQKTPARLPPNLTRRFRANVAAWNFFQAQPRGYRQQIIHGVISAQQPATQLRRLDRAIAASARGERLR
jgi:uncharacterized protein YdeI (YjbR/CyaY-like superfamily)